MNFLDILKVCTVLQLCVLSIFLLTHAANGRQRNLLLASFVIAKAVYLVDTLLIRFFPAVTQYAPNAILIGTSFQLLLGPAILGAIAGTVSTEFRLRPRHLLHLAPFALHLGFIVTQFHVEPTAAKLQMLTSGFPYSAIWWRPVTLGIYLHFTAYGIASFVYLTRMRDEFASWSSQAVGGSIAFLKFLVLDFAVVWGVNIVSMYVWFGQPGWTILGTVTVLNIFFVANALVYQGLKFPQMYHGAPLQKEKYERNRLTDEEKERFAAKVREHMTAARPYLNPTYSLADMSTELALPAHVLSQVLNVVLKQSFYDLVNSYRVEETKRLLGAGFNGNGTILEALFRSGFNSKSVFNAAFKKHTGMTPRQFRKNITS